jgi:murein DD-endopeptidase MepM/ murein hydrolase activator NlpD
MIRISLLFSFVLFFLHQTLLAQITVDTERDKDNNVNFFANNPTDIPYTLVLNFSNLQNMTTTGGGNTTAVANPGRTRVATLRPTVAGQGTNYRYSFSYAKGNLFAKSKVSPAYLVPVPAETIVHAALINPISITSGGNSSKNSYVGVSFRFEKPTQILAPRKGIISEMKMDAQISSSELSYSSQENFIEIYHEDGTFTKLTVLKSGTEKVKLGQQVFPGDVLAESGGENYSTGPHVRMINLRTVKENEGFIYQAFPVDFVSDKGNLEIKQSMTLTTAHPEEIITLEMNKKELKIYMEKK